jgi:hypothetical protein
MATTPATPIVSAFNLTTAWQDLYTVIAPSSRVSIDAVVFNNYSSDSVTFSARIVQSGTGTDLNEVITEKDIRAQGNDLAPSMIGQALTLGGKIQAKASVDSSVNVNITATLIST